ncbi:Hypothetical_protein [Hexamita inflata]|uniref:Hypothetical_protein n=1 Tax=Hexamita inflata TaxID=28002 RepID=A0AA86ULJ9_9EUKA|nr:Hypothetical protein HINF_LOCUS50685 [Hexamita inflata]
MKSNYRDNASWRPKKPNMHQKLPDLSVLEMTVPPVTEVKFNGNESVPYYKACDQPNSPQPVASYKASTDKYKIQNTSSLLRSSKAAPDSTVRKESKTLSEYKRSVSKSARQHKYAIEIPEDPLKGKPLWELESFSQQTNQSYAIGPPDHVVPNKPIYQQNNASNEQVTQMWASTIRQNVHNDSHVKSFVLPPAQNNNNPDLQLQISELKQQINTLTLTQQQYQQHLYQTLPQQQMQSPYIYAIPLQSGIQLFQNNNEPLPTQIESPQLPLQTKKLTQIQNEQKERQNYNGQNQQNIIEQIEPQNKNELNKKQSLAENKIEMQKKHEQINEKRLNLNQKEIIDEIHEDELRNSNQIKCQIEKEDTTPIVVNEIQNDIKEKQKVEVKANPAREAAKPEQMQEMQKQTLNYKQNNLTDDEEDYNQIVSEKTEKIQRKEPEQQQYVLKNYKQMQNQIDNASKEYNQMYLKQNENTNTATQPTDTLQSFDVDMTDEQLQFQLKAEEAIRKAKQILLECKNDETDDEMNNVRKREEIVQKVIRESKPETVPQKRINYKTAFEENMTLSACTGVQTVTEDETDEAKKRRLAKKMKFLEILSKNQVEYRQVEDDQQISRILYEASFIYNKYKCGTK